MAQLDIDDLSLWANTKCKTCYGRGYYLTELGATFNHKTLTHNVTIRNDRPDQIKTYGTTCSCVAKNKAKYKK